MSLGDAVRSRLLTVPGRVGFYARNLRTSERVSFDGDAVLPTESAAKTFILLHYSALVAASDIDPGTRVALDSDTDAVIGSGVLRYLDRGLELTLEDLARLMIIVSDNVATHILLRTVGGPSAVNATIDALGVATARLDPAFDYRNIAAGVPFATSSARDLGEAYTHLDGRCRRILFRQQFQEGLPRRLPQAAQATDFGFEMPVRVFNKTGGGLGTYVDSGLFEADQASWIVAAMATDQQDFAHRPDDAAPSAFADVGELLYEHWG